LAHHGTGLGVDLYNLEVAGRELLPAVADIYTSANRSIASTDSELASAFRRPEQLGGGEFGPLYANWRALRDELQKVLGDTADNLRLLGHALNLAAIEYAKTDRAASAKLDSLESDHGNWNTTTAPNPLLPTDPTTGQGDGTHHG
jgi:hypothetical protein